MHKRTELINWRRFISSPARYAVAFSVLALSMSPALPAQSNSQYRIFAGNTHSHTELTWSHGEQWEHSPCAGILVYGSEPADPFVSLWSKGYVFKNKCPGIYVINSWQLPSPGMTLKPDWKSVQGLPSRHYQLAKQDGYDFYVTSDHSQEAVFSPSGPANPAWQATKQQAAAATGPGFVALAGFEFSENNGPGGRGHINVINTASILNALTPGVDLSYLYRWLATAKPNGDGPVVASFNHPGPDQYADWAGRTPAVTDVITMLEVINHNDHIHYQAFVNALDKGWKVSPVCGLDNHGLTGIGKFKSRTFVLASAKTKVAILDAMKHRRTYASLDNNLQCRYSVNGKVMGSTLDHPSAFHFDIHIIDPDTSNPADKITKIDIVKDHGEIAQTYTPTTPGYDVTWKPTITDAQSRYFFVRVWNAGGGDAPHPDPTKPVAWLAPVWTGR